MPTDVSSAEDTTTGRPICSAIRRQARTPPSGWTLSTAMSAACSRATRRGSSARRIDSSAATGTATFRRTAASSSTVRHGCSTYSSPTRSSSATIRTAVSTSQPPFASTRTRPAGPSASRTASTRARSSASVWPGSATLTLAVRQPADARTMSAAACGPTAGTVTLTGTEVRSGAGQPRSAASRAAASHGTHSAASYSQNGDHSPQPAAPRSRTPSRTSMPRNRVRIGTDQTTGSATGALRPTGDRPEHLAAGCGAPGPDGQPVEA